MTRPEGPAPVGCDINVRLDIPPGVVPAGSLHLPITATFLGDILELEVRVSRYRDRYCFSLYLIYTLQYNQYTNAGSNTRKTLAVAKLTPLIST